jgi:hypothetical protein
VAANPSTPLDVLAVLVMDTSPDVQQMALDAFQKRLERDASHSDA